ncbi:MAG: ATP/GTP-binding protein, partial [Candidatus Delongbacteria bacterium]
MKNNIYGNGFQFVHSPVEFDKFSDKEILQYCLGATLYMPGTKNILDKILNRSFVGLSSMVMCFEDAIDYKDLGLAEQNVLNLLRVISGEIKCGRISHSEIPLFFLRVRDLEQLISFTKNLDSDTASV